MPRWSPQAITGHTRNDKQRTCPHRPASGVFVASGILPSTFKNRIRPINDTGHRTKHCRSPDENRHAYLLCPKKRFHCCSDPEYAPKAPSTEYVKPMPKSAYSLVHGSFVFRNCLIMSTPCMT